VANVDLWRAVHESQQANEKRSCPPPSVVVSNFPGTQHDSWNVDGFQVLASYTNFGLIDFAGTLQCTLKKQQIIVRV